MTSVVEFRAIARMELDEAAEWYEAQRAGLGVELLHAVEATLERIRLAPEGHELVAKHTRRGHVRPFPYCLDYICEADRIVVTAVFHTRRDRRNWSDRVREGLTIAAM